MLALFRSPMASNEAFLSSTDYFAAERLGNTQPLRGK